MLLQKQLIDAVKDAFRVIIREEIETGINKALKDLKEAEEEIMDVPAVTQLFGVFKVTIHRWKKDKVIPFHYINPRVRFFRSEMMEVH